MAGTEFEQHTHESLVHDHEHWHVTHNWSETAGTFEHLASRHSHPHDHAELTHSHVPHVDFDSEHAGEAHIHDHDQPGTRTRDADQGRTPARSTSVAPRCTWRRPHAHRLQVIVPSDVTWRETTS